MRCKVHASSDFEPGIHPTHVKIEGLTSSQIRHDHHFKRYHWPISFCHLLEMVTSLVSPNPTGDDDMTTN
jgi:hypothetical protein